MHMSMAMSMKTLKALLLIAMIAIILLASSFAKADKAEAWLNYGPIYQYPSTGGTWKYGFWNAKVRSYYKVYRCHGSTVYLNGNWVRSANTAPGYWSIAHKSAINWWGADDRYYYRVC